MSEIKPCPFCGNSEDLVIRGRVLSYIYCWNCGAESGLADSKDEAIEAWNQRPYDYDMLAIVKKVERLEEENKKLRISLYAYSNQYNWTRGYVWAGDDNNGYELAKSTLEELKSCKRPE